MHKSRPTHSIIKKALFWGIGIHLLAAFVASCIGGLQLDYLPDAIPLEPFVIVACISFLTYRHRKSIDHFSLSINFLWLLVSLCALFILIQLGHGGFETEYMTYMCYVLFPYLPSNFLLFFWNELPLAILSSILGFATAFITSLIWGKDIHFSKRGLAVCCTVLLVLSITCGYLYLNRPEKKYAGHGFDYMHGYSSTDFSGYHIYSNPSKLATLDHKSSLQIKKDHPVMDGAEACYPLYSAIAKAVYVDIENEEKRIAQASLTDKDLSDIDKSYISTNGKVVSFTNTLDGFDRLLSKKVDLFFGARPSADQMAAAQNANVELEITPIGKEGFVFFVEEENPVENVSSEQMRSIYHGDIDNWKDVGGNREKIIAFQRPENSGSQTMMQYFMKNVTLKKPVTYETVSSMEGVLEEVADYANEKGALGYTFRYFLEGLHQEKNVKMLSINGVYPSREAITDGSYPLTVDLCLITRKNDKNKNVQKVKDFILSEDGQYLVEETGYSRLPNH